MKHLLSLAGLVTLATACGAAEPTRVQNIEKNNARLSDDAVIVRPRLDPATAAVSLVTDPFLSPASEGSSLRVPTLLLSGLEDEKADYVQVARCAVGTELETSTGVAFDAIPASSTRRLDDLKWIWINKVWSNTSRCKIVGGASARVARDRFQDLTAPSSEFFYVVNPCFLEERSNRKEVCSYNLVVTSPIAFTHALREDFLSTAERLAQAEAVLAGQYSQLYYGAQAIRQHQEACENNRAVTESARNFWKGVTSLTLGGVGAAIGSVMSGGTAALEGFKTGLGIAVGIFKRQPDAPQVCPLVDPLILRTRAASEKIDAALGNVLALRKQLSEIESTYAELDDEVQRQ